jgi:hypothetical protein
MNEIKLHFSVQFIILMILMGICSFGLMPLFLWLGARSWPRLIDQDGMTLRNGKRLSWKDVTEFRRVNLRIHGISAGGRIEVLFGKKKVPIPLNSFSEGREVLAFLSQRFGWT